MTRFCLFKKTGLYFYMLVFLFACHGVSFAADPKELYISAEGHYKKLRHNPQKKKYRDNWLACIKKFHKVYQYDPDGPWAAAGLYMSGKLHWELYRYSGYDPDKKEAIDIFQQIINRYPKSRYRKKSSEFMSTISRHKPYRKKSGNTSKSPNNIPKEKFIKAEKSYYKLLADPKKQKFRHNWLACIEKFHDVYDHDPKGPWAAAGLYMKGVLYEELSKRSFSSLDKKKALDVYQRVVTDYPKSLYKTKASDRLIVLCTSDPGCEQVTKDHLSASKAHKSSMKRSISKKTKDQNGRNKKASTIDNGGETLVSGIRFWSTPSYTRVVIDADGVARFEHHLLKKDSKLKKPPRLYIDLNHSRLGRDIKKTIPINDNLLSGIRAAQHTKDSVRVVIDIKSFKTYKIFPLREPTRIVVDVWGGENGPQRIPARDATTITNNKIPPGALAKQLALGVRRVVIDPGHGGKDPGALGYLKNVREKDVALSISKLLAKKIKENLQCEVILTRNKDRFISLEERTAFANTKNADLFISIHANAHKNRKSYGLETFFLNLATDEESILVAARENATSTKNISDLHSILSDLMQNAKINESSRLAAYVQEAMYRDLKTRYKYIKNNGVKQAPFYVLLGAQMPAILIETSFISNPRECKRLIDAGYQNRLCDAIVKGIRNYIRETSPNKISNIKQKNGTTG